MSRPSFRPGPRALAGVGAAALLAVPLVSAPADAAPAPAGTAHRAVPPHSGHVRVPMSDDGFRLPARIQAGWTTFRASTDSPEGHQLEGFRTRHGATAAEVVDDIKRAVSFDADTAIAGLADTRHDAVLVGGPSVDPATPVSVTMPLRAGRFYFFDFNDFFTAEQEVTLHQTRVVGDFEGHAPRGYGRIREAMVAGAPRFLGSAVLPATRTIEVRNTSDDLHEVLLGRVRRGTTDDDVQAYYESGSTDTPSYALESPLRGVAAMDPGRTVFVRFPRLDPGRYSLLCFAPDTATGMPHVVMGMHRVVSMRDRKGS